MTGSQCATVNPKHSKTSLYYWIVIILLLLYAKLSTSQSLPNPQLETVSVTFPVIQERGEEIRYKKGETLKLSCEGNKPLTWRHSKYNISQNSRANWTASWHQTRDKPFASKLVITNLIQDDMGVLFCTYKDPLYASYVDNIYLKVVEAKGLSAATKAILGILIVLCIVLFVGLIIVRRFRSKQKRKRNTKQNTENPEEEKPLDTDPFLRAKEHEEFYKGAVEFIDPEMSMSDQADLLPFDKSHWEFPRDRLKLGAQLGSGAFGRVVKAEAIGLVDNERSTTVAVKMIKPSADECHFKALICELKIMAHLGRHLNVVNLLGACTKNLSTNNELYVLVEYCKHGSLLSYIRRYNRSFVNQIVIDGDMETVDPNVTDCVISIAINMDGAGGENCGLTSGSSENSSSPNKRNTVCERTDSIASVSEIPGQTIRITTSDLLCWAFQVARGMEYLASRKVIHGDLAARNVLLTENNVVKICDFGLAKEMYRDYNYIMSTKGGNFPVKWMALESIYYGELSTESDCWSFGIVLWELFSLGKIPYPGIKADEDLIKNIDGGYRMGKPEYCPVTIYQIMTDCWEHEKKNRPSFPELANRLGSLIEEKERDHYIQLNDEYLKKSPAPRALDVWSEQSSAAKPLEQDSYGYLKPIQINNKPSNDLEHPTTEERNTKSSSGNNYVPDPTKR